MQNVVTIGRQWSLSLVLASLGWVACSGFDGGLEPIGKLPPPLATDASADTGPEAEVGVEPTLAFVRPSEGASVDGDWVEIELALEGATLDAATTVGLSALDGDGAAVVSTSLTTLSTVLKLPEGTFTLRAELLAGGAPLEPPVRAEVVVTATRVTPALAFVAPESGQRFDRDMEIPYALALTDFTLLATGASPTGPRQGRIALVVDDGEPVVSDALEGTLPAQVAGEHRLVATLVDAGGAPWDPPVSASVSFAVDLPPTVTILSPADGETVEGGRLVVVIATERFLVDGVDAPGHGTWLIRLDGATIASELTGLDATVTGLAAGPHTLEVELRTAADEALAPPVTAALSFETELLPPAIEIVLPTSDRVAEGAVRVAVRPHFFAFTNGTIPSPLVPATGGWQLLVDGAVVADRLTTAQTEVVLAPGSRELTARLIDNAGALVSPLAEASKTLEVAEIETAVEILSPAPGAVVPKRFPVAVAFEDFRLTQTVLAPDDPPVPGQGHFHAFLRKEGTADFVYQGFFLSETFELQADSAGEWEVLVALHHENHEPVLPAVEDSVRVTVDDRPTIHIASPRDGDVVARDPFAVSVTIDNFELIPVGEVSNARGHYHLFIDEVYQGFFLEPVALVDPLAALPAALSPGRHELTAFLHRSDHTPVDGSVGHTIELVYDDTPRVAIREPADGVRVTTAPFMVSFELDNLTLVDKAGDPAVPGQGHVHVFVDDVYQGFETRSTFPLVIPDPGPHTIKLTLHENDHAAIEGAIPAFVDVVVDAAPRVPFLAPEDWGFVYGSDLEVVLAPENLPDDALVELWIDSVLFYQGVATTPVEVPRLEDGMHTMFTVPLDAEGTPLPDGEVVTIAFEATSLSPPTISFVAPLPNATLGPSATVTVGLTGFQLDGGLGKAPAVPGDGLWTLSAGDRVYGPFASQTVALPALPPGPTQLRATLWHRDGSRVVPAEEATVPVQIGAGAALSLEAPLFGQMFYGPDVELRARVRDHALGPGEGWLSVRVDGRQAALLARDHGIVGPFATGLHVLELELYDADRRPLEPPVKVTSQLRVGGPTVPSLSITSPSSGASVEDGAVDVAFTVAGVELDPVGLRGRAQAGRGAVVVSLDGRVRAIATSSPVRFTGLTPGAHTIEVVLTGIDLLPLAPRVSDRIEIDVAE